MIAARLIRCSVVRLLPVLLGALLGGHVLAAEDPPGRVARLNDGEGTVVYSPAGDNEWTDADYNRPLTRGDRLWTDRGSRAEIQVGSAAVRIDGRTHLEITTLDDQSAQLSVTQGSVYAHVRDLPEGENFEIDTPNLAFRAAYPGDYRIDVDPVRGTTRVTIHSGTGAVYGDNAEALPLGGGQQIMFRARGLAKVNTQESPPQDGFDRWAVERNHHEDQSISARYVPREVVGYQQLDAHGQWQRDPEQGYVWFPIVKGADWAPYRAGHWEWIAPWGWTWIDDAPWGFAPFHYGRWTQIGSRWAWVPGRMGAHPVYAPALVAFVSGGQPGVAWFPLAPGEQFQPGYAVSPLYISNVNRNITLQADPTYVYQRRPEALTAISTEDFRHGRPARAGWLRVAANVLTQAQIVPPPPQPARSGIVEHPRAAVVAQVTPPAATEARQVVANAVPARPAASAAPTREPEVVRHVIAPQAPVRVAAQTPAPQPVQQQAQAKPAVPPVVQAQAKPQPVQPAPVQAQIKQAPVANAQAKPTADAQRVAAAQAAEQERQRRQQLAQRAEQAKHEEQARREQQAKLAEQAHRAEQAKADKQARREQSTRLAEQARREQTRRAELARREEQAHHAEQARREQQAKREQQLAKRAEQTRREEQAQARRADQVRREAVARREDQERRDAHAKVVEQARRAADRDALALREQRMQREDQARREEQARREDQARRDEQARRDAQEHEVAQQRATLQQRQQQALIDQWRRDRQAADAQRERVRQRPDLGGGNDRRSRAPDWERGTTIIGAQPQG